MAVVTARPRPRLQPARPGAPRRGATAQALRDDELLRRKIIDVDPELLLPYLLDRRGRSQEMVLTGLAAIVAEGQHDGTVRKGDPVILARSLVLAAHGFTLSVHTMVDPGRPGRRADVDVSVLDDELELLVDRYLQP